MNIADKLLEHIRTQLTTDGGSIKMDCKLAQGGYLDSTAMLELILWVGDTFDIVIQNEDLTPENFLTPRNIVEFIERQKRQTPEPLVQQAPSPIGGD